MNYHDIVHDDMLNGDGLRVTLFVSGCSLHCPNCQNPQAQNPNSGILFDNSALEEIDNELSKPYISGLTLTGGHPLEDYNYDEVLALCKHVKEKFPDKTIWLYTGYTYETIMNYEIMTYIDVLIDGNYQEKLRNISLKWRGSSNQRVIDINKTKSEGKVVLYCD